MKATKSSDVYCHASYNRLISHGMPATHVKAILPPHIFGKNEDIDKTRYQPAHFDAPVLKLPTITVSLLCHIYSIPNLSYALISAPDIARISQNVIDTISFQRVLPHVDFHFCRAHKRQCTAITRPLQYELMMIPPSTTARFNYYSMS